MTDERGDTKAEMGKMLVGGLGGEQQSQKIELLEAACSLPPLLSFSPCLSLSLSLSLSFFN